jgi:hypothetical protein
VRLCYLSRFLLVFGSLEFCLVPLPLFVLVLFVFACLWFSPSSDWYRTSGLSVFSGVKKFWPTPLYKASMHIVRVLHAAIHSLVYSFVRSFPQGSCTLVLDTLHPQCISCTRNSSCTRLLRYSLWSSSSPLVPHGILRYTLRYLAVSPGTRSFWILLQVSPLPVLYSLPVIAASERFCRCYRTRAVVCFVYLSICHLAW